MNTFLLNPVNSKLIFETGFEIILHNIKLSLTSLAQEVWVEREEYAQYGWMLPPSPETHNLFHIIEGIELKGEAEIAIKHDFSDVPLLILQCENNKSILLKSDVKVTIAMNNWIQFKNFNKKV